MKKEELQLFVKGIFIAYQFLEDNQEMDRSAFIILENNIFKAIRELKQLPFSLPNLWYAFKTRRKLQKLYLELHTYYK
ncbi:hypothetical protein [Staphylococcus chromogenes]|uniref:hypothetical protein n=1 Tax=Staphylococcus chromogenes TaxID=46126 RepID=UPI0028874145|nr:hypothetical protein [Staphylococcus chromogenes]MDT0700321.1 hypothetical protein [Staphylococcus chromogenes]